MLRITQRAQGKSRQLLVLEGWVVSDSLSVLEEALQKAKRQAAEVALDFGQVSYVDSSAVERLTELRREGVRVVGASEVVNEILEG